jgi:hypothetical protein
MINLYRMVLKHETKELYLQPILACTTPEEAVKAVDIYGTDGFHFVRLENLLELAYISKGAQAALKYAWVTCKDGKASPGEQIEPEATE